VDSDISEKYNPQPKTNSIFFTDLIMIHQVSNKWGRL